MFSKQTQGIPEQVLAEHIAGKIGVIRGDHKACTEDRSLDCDAKEHMTPERSPGVPRSGNRAAARMPAVTLGGTASPLLE